MIEVFIKVLGEPGFEPPECIFNLNLNVSNFKDFLNQLSKEVCVRFAVGEARLVLPVFEDEFPGDDRPRRAIEAAECWLSNPSVSSAYAATYAAYSATARYSARSAADAARSAAGSSVAAGYAGYSAYAATYAAYAADARYAAADAARSAEFAASASSGAVHVNRQKQQFLEDQIKRLLSIITLYKENSE